METKIPVLPTEPPRSSIVHAEEMFPVEKHPDPSIPVFTAAELLDLGVVVTESHGTRTVEFPYPAQKKLLESVKHFGFGATKALDTLLQRCLAVLGFDGKLQFAVQDETLSWRAWQTFPKPEPVASPAMPPDPATQTPPTSTPSGLATFASGAVRDQNVAGSKTAQFPARYDLLSPIGIRRIAETYGEGALKYDDHNWRKGMPISTCLNHALAHVFAYMTGDESEDHMAHAAWNLFAVMHFEETNPQLFDLKTDDYLPTEPNQ